MSTSMLPSLVAFVAVILMIPAALWLVKRSQSPKAGGSGPLSVIAGMPVGPRERIAVVQVADRYLVVGITGQSMSLLATLDDWPVASAATSASSPFSALLDRVNRNARRDA